MSETKTCRVCQETKDAAEFPQHPRGSYGVAGTCRYCFNKKKREKLNEKYATDASYAEKRRDYQRNQIIKNKDAILRKNRERYLNNDDLRVTRNKKEAERRITKKIEIQAWKKHKIANDEEFRNKCNERRREWMNKKLLENGYREWLNMKAREYYARRKDDESFNLYMAALEAEYEETQKDRPE